MARFHNSTSRFCRKPLDPRDNSSVLVSNGQRWKWQMRSVTSYCGRKCKEFRLGVSAMPPRLNSCRLRLHAFHLCVSSVLHRLLLHCRIFSWCHLSSEARLNQIRAHGSAPMALFLSILARGLPSHEAFCFLIKFCFDSRCGNNVYASLDLKRVHAFQTLSTHSLSLVGTHRVKQATRAPLRLGLLTEEVVKQVTAGKILFVCAETRQPKVKHDVC